LCAPAPTQTSTPSLHDALPISLEGRARGPRRGAHLLDRALRRVAGELLGRRVDHRVRPPGGAHPLAADQDLVDDGDAHAAFALRDRKSTRLNSSHDQISYAVFC